MADGITGISPLGTFGLGTMGGFGSYDMYMPSMMGMNPMFGGFGGYGMGMIDPYMQSMYNPVFMSQMQNKMEELQVKHANNMHGLMLNNEVQAYQQTDSALIRKLLTNGSVQQGIYNLHQKIVEGDQNGVCEQYDRLQTEIYNNYANEFKSRGSNTNPVMQANQIIEELYTSIISKQEGSVQTLRGNIEKYGDGAFKNGFMKGLTIDHHDRDIDSTMNHIYGTRIDHKGSKDRINKFGKGLGHVTRSAGIGLIGGSVGAGITAAIAAACKSSHKGPWALGIGAVVGVASIIGDLLWRHTSD